ncbi:MAG: hypothetical protein ACJAR3_001994 [Roseivirga sp.]|jgi:hypothetical protein
MRNIMSTNSSEWTISYRHIGIILISFVLGLIAALLISNAQATTSTNFTTTELISFVLSVILSGASIVLAIAAIALGKSSELAVINRSDESIRIQTEVFTKTTDALQGIKSSTDVTEKRIEDIISGRAGDISKQIAEFANEGANVGSIDIKELEEKIKNSITGSFENKVVSEDEKKRRMERRGEYQKIRMEYEKYHDIFLYEIANKENVKILKLGHGYPRSENKDLYERYDAVYEKENKLVAVSTLEPANNDKFLRSINEMLPAFASAMKAEQIDKLYLIFFEEEADGEKFTQANQIISMMKTEISSRIQLCPVSYSETKIFAESVEL